MPVPINAYAQQKYTYQGKEISKEYFDALNSARDAQPLMRAGKYEQVEPILKKALEGAADNPDILANYALVLVKLGRANEAIPVYEKVARIEPDSESCWIGWSGAYGALGKIEDSLRICKEFLKKFPKSEAFSQMQNQAATLEKEVKRLAVARAASGGPESDASHDYFSEAIIGAPHRWNLGAPLSVFISDGKDVAKWRASFNPILKQAFIDWSERSGGLVKFDFVEDAKDAKIICIWIGDPKLLTNTAELGKTDTTWAEDGQLIKATVKLSTIIPTNPEMILSDEKLRQTSLHEIGHALGINGHSASPSDAMYFANITVNDPKLSERDINTLLRLYNSASNN